VHSNGTSGALVLLGCETDFVANNEEFKALARDLAMHACAMMPETVEDMLAQPFVKDGEKTVKQKLEEAVQKFGENTQLVKISRVSI
jgi:elongation factor Ts